MLEVVNMCLIKIDLVSFGAHWSRPKNTNRHQNERNHHQTHAIYATVNMPKRAVKFRPTTYTVDALHTILYFMMDKKLEGDESYTVILTGGS